jgi:hypothetical protein
MQISGAIYVVAPPLFISYPLRKRPLRFALALGAIILAAGLMTGMSQNLLSAQRNFFGVVRVINDPQRQVHSFLHGSTVHGRQNTVPERRCEPLFLLPSGRPARSHLFADRKIAARSEHRCHRTRHRRHGLLTRAPISIGPFTRSIPRSCQSRGRRSISVISTSVRRRRSTSCSGDARLQMHSAPDRVYDVIVLDAFSSDAIPIHLVTQQALDLYLAKVKPAA